MDSVTPDGDHRQESGGQDGGLTVLLREFEQPPRLIVVGELDAATEEEFRAAVTSAAKRFPRLMIDMTGVAVRSGAAARVLQAHLEQVVAVLVASGSMIGRVLGTAGYPRLVTVPTQRHAGAARSVAPPTGAR